MIKSACSIEFENEELSKEITLPCENETTQEQYCIVGTLQNNMCVYSICPDGYTDNGENCRKEVPSIQTGIVFYPGRFWTGSAFGSYTYILDLGGNIIDINTIFQGFTRTGTMGFVIDGQSYTAQLSSNIVGNTQISFIDGSDPFAVLIPNSRFTYANEFILGQGTATTVTWGGQTFTEQISTSCPVGTSKIGDKCYEVVNKIQSQEVPQTTTIIKEKIAQKQTVIVKKGEVTSDISQAHADYLAEELLDKRLKSLLPICIDKPVYNNIKITKTGKKPCVVGTPCDVTVSVLDGEFTSTISVEDAQNKAQVELNNRFNNAVSCCIIPTEYLSNQKEITVEKICPVGFTPNPTQLNLTIPQGGNSNYNNILIPAFTSSLSQEEANNKRDIWLNTNLYLFKNQIRCDEILVNDSKYWTVETLSNTGGTITPIGKSQVKDQANFYFKATALPNYKIKSIKVDNQEVTINSDSNYERTFKITKDTVISVEFELIDTPVVQLLPSSLYLSIFINNTINENEVRARYNIVTPTETLNSATCPCLLGEKGDVGYYSPSGSPILVGSGISNITLANFMNYGGVCGSTGCPSGGLGVTEIKPNTNQTITITQGAGSFVRWEYSYGTLLGTSTKNAQFSSLTNPTLNVFIPDGCHVSIQAIFE